MKIHFSKKKNSAKVYYDYRKMQKSNWPPHEADIN